MEKNLITKNTNDLQQSLSFSGESMTVKQLSDILGVTDQAIRDAIKKLFPEIMAEHGKTTYLNEIQVTAIKLQIQSGGKRNSKDNLGVKNAQTRLEKALLIKQAMELQQEIIEEQQAEIDVLKPKAIQYDTFMDNRGAQKIGDVAYTLGLKPHKLFQMLRDAKILKENYTPYSGFEQYFETVESPTKGGFNVFTSYIKPNGVDYIARRFNLQKSA